MTPRQSLGWGELQLCTRTCTAQHRANHAWARRAPVLTQATLRFTDAQGQAGQSDAGSKPEAQELPEAAAGALLQLYREQAPDKVYMVEALLRRQGLL